MAPTLYDEKPEPGDLIEIFRSAYQHWAVYVGEGFVVHLAPPSEAPGAGSSSVMSVLTEKAVVKKEELWDVEACVLVGQELNYCVVRGNCEHFVTELRYGKAKSRQVQKAGEAVMLVGVAAAVALGAVALAGALFGGSKKEKKNSNI